MTPTLDCIINPVARTAAALLFPAALLAQFDPPIIVVRGELAGWSGSARAGEIEIRGAGNAAVSCAFDLNTGFERDRIAIPVTALAPGDRLEIIADRTAQAACYARTVQIIDPNAPAVTPGHFRPLTENLATEIIAPRGDALVGGRVTQIADSAMSLDTRDGPVQVTFLEETRFFEDGRRIDSPPGLNQHVFVRGTRLVNGIEAYQVSWGKIVN